MLFRTRIDLQNIEETFTRPALVSIMKDVKHMLSIDPNTYTLFDVKDSLIKELTPDGELQGKNDIKSEMVLVDYEENMMDNEELCRDSQFDNDLAIFRDPDIQCSLRPIFHHRKFDIHFRYKTKFKNRAMGLTSRLKMMPATQSYYNYHNIEYSYILPVQANRWLKMVYTLKTKREQDKIDLEPYLASTFDDRVEYFNRADGAQGKSRLAIRERQTKAVGYITTDLYNIKPEYDEEEKNWVIELEYEVLLEKPVSLVAQYPIMIYNTLVPKPYRYFPQQYKKRELAGYMAKHDDKTVLNTRGLWEIYDDRYYLCVPEQDQPDVPDNPNRNMLLSVLCHVDDTDDKKLFNIKQLGKISFNQYVEEFIIREHEVMHIDNRSIFNMKLYVDGKAKFEKIRMDKDGNIFSIDPLDYHKTYRVIFSYINDPVKLAKPDKDRINNTLNELHKGWNAGNKIWPADKDNQNKPAPDKPWNPWEDGILDPKPNQKPTGPGTGIGGNTDKGNGSIGNNGQGGGTGFNKVEDRFSVFDFSKTLDRRMFTVSCFTVRALRSDGNPTVDQREILNKK